MTRRITAVAAAVLLVSLAGCSVLSGPISFTANKAVVEQSTLEQSDYEEAAVQKKVIERTFSRAGVEKTVKVTNWQAMYERSVDLGPLGEKRAAVFSLFSTPKVEVAGQGPFNPVADYSNERLVKLVQQQYEGLSDVQKVSERNLTMLGKQTTVSKFSAKATLQGGTQVDVYVHVTKVAHGDDYVIAVAVHPQQINEQQHINTLIQNVEHDTSDGGS